MNLGLRENGPKMAVRFVAPPLCLRFGRVLPHLPHGCSGLNAVTSVAPARPSTRGDCARAVVG